MPDTYAGLNLDLIAREFPPAEDGSIYLNSGSCGRKPQSVLKAIQEGWLKLNVNPTLFTFLDPSAREEARKAAASLFDVDRRSLLLTHNTTDGLQLVMQSFLLNPGDELVTTDHEHGSLKTIHRYLQETRGIVVREYHAEPLEGSESLCTGILELVNEKTKLVEVSEIDCLSGWRPDLTLLTERLRQSEIPLLVDGAHAPGQGLCRPSRYPLWVGSGHKWLGGPNGTGFLYVSPELVPKLKPVWLGDRFYHYEETDLTRFECQGTTDVVRLLGLTAACRLHMQLEPLKLASRQRALVEYLRGRLADLPGGVLRTPDTEAESTGMIVITWSPDMVSVPDLRDALWKQHRIWIQPDFYYGDPGHGMRIACHASNTEKEIDSLIAAVAKLLR